MHRPLTTAAAGLAVLALAVTGCSAVRPVPATPDGGPVALELPPAPASSPSPSVSASASPAASASPTASAGPSATVSPSPTRAAFSFDLAAVQRRLIELRYYGGTADGQRGPALRSAVMAFQKVNGLGIDGAVGPATLRALRKPKAPALRGSGPGDRVEVDLSLQVLYVVKGGAVSRILPVSSGNGATYRQKDGSLARALTPVGYYRVQRRILGVRKADLGTLYDPQYFYRGWAIHGSDSVPAGPASHGCIRVTRADATYLLRAIGVGTNVHLYGGRHVFSAGSSAPGTDAPTGDTAAPPAPRASASPSAVQPAASPKPSPSPAATAKPSASPRPSASPGG